MGQIYKAVIDRERENGYGGEDIEAIPHVTDEIISRIKAAAEKTRQKSAWLSSVAPRVSIKMFYTTKPVRIMKLRERDTIVHIHVSYLPTPAHVGEPKDQADSALCQTTQCHVYPARLPRGPHRRRSRCQASRPARFVFAICMERT